MIKKLTKTREIQQLKARVRKLYGIGVLSLKQHNVALALIELLLQVTENDEEFATEIGKTLLAKKGH